MPLYIIINQDGSTGGIIINQDESTGGAIQINHLLFSYALHHLLCDDLPKHAIQIEVSVGNKEKITAMSMTQSSSICNISFSTVVSQNISFLE